MSRKPKRFTAFAKQPCPACGKQVWGSPPHSMVPGDDGCIEMGVMFRCTCGTRFIQVAFLKLEEWSDVIDIYPTAQVAEHDRGGSDNQ